MIESRLKKYHNVTFELDRHDSSGIRFYLGKQLRQYELGYLSIGADVSYSAIAIPPGVDRFILDCYCPSEATRVRQNLMFILRDSY